MGKWYFVQSANGVSFFHEFLEFCLPYAVLKRGGVGL